MKKVGTLILAIGLVLGISGCKAEVDSVELTGITVTPPSKLIYNVGEELNTEGMEVTATYSDESTKDVTAEATTSGFDSSKAAESQVITVTYGGKTAIFTVKILAIELTKIEITTQPVKKDYFVGAKKIDTTGMVVTATYNNGTTADVTKDAITSGFNSSAAADSQIITVTYGGKTATFTVKIIAIELTKIEITNEPAKKKYLVGAANLDLKGMKVKAIFNDNSTQDVTEKVTVSGFDSSKIVESQIITVTYGGKTATFNVKILEVTKIEIIKQPTKKEYFIGMTILDLKGMVVIATYNDNSTEDVTSEVTTSGFDSSSAVENKTITVTYEGKIASFTVTIVTSKIYLFHDTVTVLPPGTDGTYGTEGTYVEFGDWPQNEVEDNDVTNLKLETSTEKITRGYLDFVKGLDGNYYVKHENNWYKVMPIKWRVADTAYDIDGSSGSLTSNLLVAENILTANIPFFGEYFDLDYSKPEYLPAHAGCENIYYCSRVRAYLTGSSYYRLQDGCIYCEECDWEDRSFLHTAFGTSAQNAIISTKVDNSIESTTNYDTKNGTIPKSCGYSNTEDKIFLLSEYEVTKYSKSTEAYNSSGTGNSRIRVPTDFAKANGASYVFGYGGYWWLRTPLIEYLNVRCIRADGYADCSCCVDIYEYGIVPALCISF